MITAFQPGFLDIPHERAQQLVDWIWGSREAWSQQSLMYFEREDLLVNEKIFCAFVLGVLMERQSSLEEREK